MKDQSKTKQALIKELVALRKKMVELERPESGASSTKHRQPQHVEGRDKNSTVSSKIKVSGINVEWDAKQGTCTFEDLPVAMMWVDTTLAGLMSGVQAMVGTERFFLALQSEGRKSVEADWQVISQHSDFRDGFKAIANIAAVAGWGYWELAFFDVNKSECHFRVRDSWEGRYQKSLGVCWGSGMLAGKMAGYCSKLFGTNCWADQTQFIAKGDNCDEFVVKPSPRLIENEIENLLASDEATRADMAVALKKLEKEITERKHAEQVLRDNEEYYRNVFENHAAVKLIIDPDTGSIVEANEAAASYYGWSHEHLKQMKIEEINTLPPEDVKKEMKKARTKKQIIFEFRHRRADGSIRDVEVFSSNINLKGKDLLHSIIHDITERKRAEEVLRKQEVKLLSIFRAAPVGIGMVINRVIQEANETLCQITGYSREDLVGRDARMLYPTRKDYDYVGREKYRQMGEKSTGTVETRWKRKDGAVIDIILSSTPLEPNDLAKGVTFTALDITERKRAEDALRKNEEKYRLTFSSISDIIYTIDSDLRISSVSPNVEKILGYKIEELINRPFMELTLLTPESLEKAISNTMRVLSGEHILAEVYEFIAKDGTRRFGEISGSPLIHEGRIVGLTSVARDITERKLLESQLRQAQKMEAIGTLAGGIAHDFNNILGAILGYTDMALADQKMDDRQRRYLEQVFKAGERARDLVKQILTFSRQREQEKKPVLIAPIIKEGIKMLRSSLPTTVKIIQNIKDESLMVLADPIQIHQVVMNLCTNAAHAMREKGGTLDIEIVHERIESSRTSILG
ncbi:MAG: PAS domain S-box protein, partial [Syntrophaceae bacterium]|nr:PAS domain S-box protein [Syntrophaceae bacterium]